MITTTDDHMSQFILDPVTGLEHRRQHAVSIEGVSDAMLFEMRELLQWVAYRLDVGNEGRVENHLLAVTLRSISDTYYPHNEDFATYLAEELEEGGESVNVPKIDPPHCRFDLRLLDLEDGFAVLRDSFSELLAGDEVPHPVLLANSNDTLDFAFPERAVSTHGVKGLRLSKMDFMNYLLSARVYHDAYRSLDVVLADYQAMSAEMQSAYEQRLKDKYGPDCFDAPKEVAPLSAIDVSAVLEELAGLTV